MTIWISDHTPTTRWANPDDGLWVANDAGEHLGTVEERNTGYVVRNSRGRAIGVYPRLDEAQWALISAPQEDSRNIERALLKIAVVAALLAVVLAAVGVWTYVS